MSLDYPILSDPAKETARAWGVLGPGGFASRWTFYIGKDGRVLFVDRAVATSSHGRDIATRLAALGVPERKGR